MQTEFNDKTWGVADFERYYNGNMSAAEMHALEKAALDDPFLQDALDGYSISSTPRQEIDAIKEKLWPARDKAPVISIAWYKTKFASQLFKAASVIIIAGGLSWLLINKNKQLGNGGEGHTEIAANDAATIRDSIKETLQQLQDSVPSLAQADKPRQNEQPATPAPARESNAENTHAQATAPAPQQDERTASQAEELERNEAVAKDKSAYKPNPSLSKKTDNRKDAAPAKTTTITPVKTVGQIKGRVVNSEGEPIAYAVLQNNADKKQQVAADAQGNFVINNANVPANSNAVPVDVNAAGYEPARQYLTNNSRNNTIVLNELQNNLSNAVVADNNGKKEKYQWNGRNSRIHLRNAKPLEGWDYFYYVMNDSIANNKLLRNYKGRIVLQFGADNNGKVENIVVKKSLHSVADSIASAILYQSPILQQLSKDKNAEAVIKLD